MILESKGGCWGGGGVVCTCQDIALYWHVRSIFHLPLISARTGAVLH